MKRPAFLGFEIPWGDQAKQTKAVQILNEAERNFANLVTAYKKQEVMAKGLEKCIIQNLYAKDAGLKW